MARGPFHLTSAALGAAVKLRNAAYDRGWRKTRRLPVAVVCVGNLTVGGTGKTPFAGEVARLLSAEGWLVGILSRGYGRTLGDDPMVVSDLWHVLRGPSESGDEPFALARRLPGIPVVVGSDRHEAGRLALERFPLHALVLDDGFQHRRLHRDVDIVMLDATDPWGGGELLPAGRLREPKTALARAHAVVLTRLHQADREAVRKLVDEVRAAHPQLPILGTRTLPLHLRVLGTRNRLGLDDLRGMRVVAVAGTAKPAAFFADVAALGAVVVKTHEYPDHHPFTREETWRLAEEAKAVGADALVTTDKDSVRFPLHGRAAVRTLSLVQRVVPDDPSALARVLASRLPGPSRGGQRLGG